MTSFTCTPCLSVFDLQVLDEGAGFALFAGGQFNYAGGALARGIARWDAQHWTNVGQGLDGMVLAMTALVQGESRSEGPSIFVGGEFEHAGDMVSHNFARWGCVARSCNSDISPPGGNGEVNIDDLLEVTAAWGPCAACLPDINGDSQVNIDDLLAIITAWGPCP